MVDMVGSPCGLSDLLSTLSAKLCEIVDSEILIYSVFDSIRKSVCHCVWENGTLTPRSCESEGSAWYEPGDLKHPLLVQDVANEAGVPQLIRMASEVGMESFCAFPLGTTSRRIGALIFGSRSRSAFCETDLVFLGNIARLVTLMIENAQALAGLQREQNSISRICATLFSDRPIDQLLQALVDPIREVVGQDFTGMLIYDSRQSHLKLCHLDAKLENPEDADPCIPVNEFSGWPILSNGNSRDLSLLELQERSPRLGEHMGRLSVRSLLLVPVINRRGICGILMLSSKRENAFASHDQSFIRQVAMGVGAALEREAAGQEIASLTEKLDEGMGKLEEERLYLEEEIRSSHNFDEIVGESANLRRALAQVQTAAPSDVTVLILGETGTGKELVARAIHHMSARNDASFIKLNCAAIPSGLLESELFGHEKGAFTGAVSQKIGRLELADKGTLFLDEVGDIPLELQPKLLRVLQDQEFERLGGVRTIKVNARLIAATNRDLPKRVAAGEFRSDLFYRLYVFPVRLPALRERSGDIPRLIRYFVQKFSRRTGKRIDTIPADAMTVLAEWAWPGNVRELENLIERSVLLSEGAVLQVPMAELRNDGGDFQPETTLHSIERQHILRVLRETGGVIAGIHGAAARLGMKRTTLQSRMQRMGISRADYEQ
jgi:formate hydrogenlyase transcriptional activator